MKASEIMQAKKLSDVMFEIASENETHGIDYVCHAIAKKFGWNQDGKDTYKTFIPTELNNLIQADLYCLYHNSNNDLYNTPNNFFSAYGDWDVTNREIAQARVTYCYLLAYQLKEQGL